MRSIRVNFFYFIIVFVILIGCKTTYKPIFIQFGKEEISYADSNVKYPACMITFFIDNYKDNVYSEKYIDSVAFQLGEIKKKECSTYLIQLYKLSKKTNSKHLLKNPRDFDRYSNIYDHIYDYYWSNGKFSGRQKFKNGKLESNIEKITITDIR